MLKFRYFIPFMQALPGNIKGKRRGLQGSLDLRIAKSKWLGL
jgi:hypothetical protein